MTQIKRGEFDRLLEAAGVLKLLSNPKRLAILCHLRDGELSVGELATLVELGQSALSQHLAKLRQEQLVTTRREGQTIHYALASHEVEAIIETLHGLYCS
ncbi:MAG: metalloregulator ArsR/SmtB family transcription factor [Pseudomonadales bacterium]|nr:metalloregulator ArsR/SmtB family transcription factor [Pseudomonadales bacterium]